MLYKVVPKLLKFLEQLSNWYVRLNRSRIKGETGLRDWNISLHVLFEVLLNTCVAIAPYVPFITELMYQNLRKCIPEDNKDYNLQSIHYLLWPKQDEKLIDEKVEKSVDNMQNVIEAARLARDRLKISLKQPIMSLTVLTSNREFLDSISHL